MIKGTVKRPVYGNGDGVLNLTATVSKGTVSKTKVFNSSVKQAGMTDTQSVANDKNWLDIQGKDTITSNVVLPSVGPSGTSITWESSSATVISTSGIVVRPVNGTAIAPVTLTASITKGTVTETKVFECKVLPWTDEEEVDIDIENLTWEAIRGQNISKSEIAYDLTLPTAGSHSTTILWAPTNTTVCSVAGVITRPPFTQGDVTFSLTFTVSKGEVAKTAYILAMKVVKLPITNNEAVTRSLSLVDQSTIKGENPDLNNITMNMQLPKSVAAPECSTVTLKWDVMSPDGLTVTTTNPYVKLVDGVSFYECQITRPVSTGVNTAVTLRVTATSSVAASDDFSGYKTMVITVLKATS